VTFASLWLVTRLSSLQRKHPEIRVHVAADNRIQDLKQEQIDVAIRYSTRKLAGPGAQKLFGESVVPVCSPNLLSRHSLTSPDDLRNFALLNFEDPHGRAPWLSWNVWFEVMNLRPTVSKGALQFSHYDQVIRAAINGQGVALGRMPLIKTLIQSGQLTIPLKSKRYSIAADDRAYWLIVSPSTVGRPNVNAFVEWLKQEVTQSTAQPA
jgi:LysR family transcriptional regulator, glycine cleavage system transcriptional activator